MKRYLKKNVDYELDLLTLWDIEAVADNIAADGNSLSFWRTTILRGTHMGKKKKNKYWYKLV